MIFTLFCIQTKLKVQIKIAFLIFLIVAPPQKLAVAPGPPFETIRYLTLCSIPVMTLLKVNALIKAVIVIIWHAVDGVDIYQINGTRTAVFFK